MFAIIEFDNEKKEFAIIPLLWLSEDKLSCLWPNNAHSDKQLRHMVEEISQPKPSWSKYPLKRILETTETYAEANTALDLILAQQSSSNSSDAGVHLITAGSIEVENEEVIDYSIENSQDSISSSGSETKQTKKKKKSARKRHNNYSSDSADYQASNHRPSNVQIKKIKKSISTFNYTSGSEEEIVGEYNSQHVNNNPSTRSSSFGKKHLSDSATRGNKNSQSIPSPASSTQTILGISNSPRSGYSGCSDGGGLLRETRGETSSPSISRANQISTHLSQWQQSVTRDIERIKAVQEQQSTLLTQIWQAIQAKNIQALQRPPDVPNLPLDRSKEFGNLEIWLENEKNFVYLRTRMASIGGTTVRAAVLNMMKYVMTNRLGMAFSWAGSAPKSSNQRKKYAFKDTLTYKLINEAAILCFQGHDSNGAIIGELTDRAIGLTCQDWLKQAKHRFQYSK